MPTRKKVLSKKKVTAVAECSAVEKKSGTCHVCGCCCGGEAMVESSIIIIFGGLVIALAFFLMQSMV